MSINTPDPVGNRLATAVATLAGARYPLLFCHRNPDGDTVGAALALAMALRRLDRQPSVVCPDALPASLRFVPDSERISAVLPDVVDLLVSVDCSDPGMLGAMRDDFAHLRSTYRLLNIDHHASDKEYGDVNLVDTSAASTSEIVYDLVASLGVAIDRRMATALLTGIINDTHSFQNGNTTERAFATAAALVRAGAEPALISHELLLRRRPQSALVWGRTLGTMRIDGGGRVASAVATYDMLRECDADMADLDGIVEFLRNVAGVELAFLLKGAPDGHFKASIRTTERVDAVALTAPFGGGGHHRAAGCDIYATADEARAALIARYHELVGS